MIIVRGLVEAFALAFWVVCALGNFWLLRESWKAKRYTNISRKGNTIYDSMRLASCMAFLISGLASIYLVYETWQAVLQL